MGKNNAGGPKMQTISLLNKGKWRFYVMAAILIIVPFACDKAPSDAISDGKSAGEGKGGSMARMTILGDYLYAVDGTSLKVFHVKNPQSPQYVNDVHIGRDIETIFGFNNYLYIGSVAAVYIYDVAQPQHPVLISTIEHVLSCDPVVANDTIAFSTIRSTSQCRFDQWDPNQLLVIDVENMNDIKKTHAYQLNFSPFGLGMKDTTLFLCKGEHGIELLDIRELAKKGNHSLNPFNQITGIDAFDVIIHQNLLMVVGKDGLIFYDISDLYNINELSRIIPDS